MKKVAVIGAGITGVTTAYVLAKRGYEVTLIDRQRYPAMETSYANGGQLSASNAEAWNAWATVMKGIKWMLRGDAPFLVHPKPNWHKFSWFAEFLAAIPHYRANTIATARLAIAARNHLYSWAKDEGIDFDLKQQGILHIYRDRSGFERAEVVTKLLAEGGLQRHAVTPDDMRSIEPNLHGDYFGGFFTPSDASGDMHKFTNGLANAARQRGATFLFDRQVLSICAGCDDVTLELGSAAKTESHAFDQVVICAGVESRKLAARLGDRINIYPVKGYSVTITLCDDASKASAPHVSLLDDAAKLVFSRLGQDRLRIAGTAEFNDSNRDIRADRILPLLNWARTCMPHVSTKDVAPWAGLRPMMPNMLPKIGRGRSKRVFYNTGHGHLGWTLSAITAEMVCDAIDTNGSQP